MPKYGVVIECQCGLTHSFIRDLSEQEAFYICLELLTDEHIKDFFVYENGQLISSSLDVSDRFIG